MATSKSEIYEVHDLCDVCKKNPNVTSTCVHCEVFMCDDCTEKHPKVNFILKHKVIKLGQQPEKEESDEPALIKDDVVEFSEPKEYPINLSTIEFMAATEDLLWIGDYSNKNLAKFPSARALQKIKLDGKKMRIISSVNIDVLNICATLNNDLLVIVPGSSRLKQVKGDSNQVIDSNYNIEDGLQPACVHITKDNKVIIGALDKTNITGLLIVMDENGKYLNVHEKDEKGEPLFKTFPFNITSTDNGNIFVVDIVDQKTDSGRILLLENGIVINIYSGISSEKPLTPSHLVTTPSDNVIVADINNGLLHILNNAGGVITIFNARNIGVEKIHSLTISQTSNMSLLYIGANAFDILDNKAKLIAVTFSGC